MRAGFFERRGRWRAAAVGLAAGSLVVASCARPEPRGNTTARASASASAPLARVSLSPAVCQEVLSQLKPSPTPGGPTPISEAIVRQVANAWLAEGGTKPDPTLFQRADPVDYAAAHSIADWSWMQVAVFVSEQNSGIVSIEATNFAHSLGITEVNPATKLYTGGNTSASLPVPTTGVAIVPDNNLLQAHCSVSIG